MGKLKVVSALAILVPLVAVYGCSESTSSSGASMEVHGHSHGHGHKTSKGGGNTNATNTTKTTTVVKEVVKSQKPRKEPPAWGRKWGPAKNGG